MWGEEERESMCVGGGREGRVCVWGEEERGEYVCGGDVWMGKGNKDGW